VAGLFADAQERTNNIITPKTQLEICLFMSAIIHAKPVKASAITCPNRAAQCIDVTGMTV
jgi:hypothetical protein